MTQLSSNLAEGVRPTLPSLEVGNTGARYLSVGASIIVFAMVGFQLLHFGFGRLLELLPSAPAVFLLLLAIHVALPVSEWFIYRRLWSFPASGVAPLFRKAVINDLVFSYGGELYLYDWARSRVRDGVAPFQAIKDVCILSAMVGNIATVVMLVVTAPWLAKMLPVSYFAPLLSSALLLLGIASLVGIFRNRVFSLTRGDIYFVCAVHAVRIALTVLLAAALWAWLLPEIPFVQLFGLQALRLLVSRLPLIPNDELLFASLTILIVGHDSAISAVAALTAMALMGLHLATFVLLFIADFVSRGGRDRHGD
ncbi:hypothetical protein [Sphingomonas koreensis]